MLGLPLLKEEKKWQRNISRFPPHVGKGDCHFSYARLQRRSKDIQRNETCKLLQRMMFDVEYFSVSCETWQKKESFFSPLSVLTRKPEPRGGNCCSCSYSAVAHFQSSTETAFWFRPTLGKTWSETVTYAYCMATRCFWMVIQWHSIARLKSSTMHPLLFSGLHFQWNSRKKWKIQKFKNTENCYLAQCFQLPKKILQLLNLLLQSDVLLPLFTYTKR